MKETARMPRKPFLLRRGEGESVWSLGGRFTLKVTEADAGGRFALVEALAFRTTEPPLHIHHNEDEAWYIVDGRMTFYVGDALLEAGAGSFVFAPSGIAHTFTVDVEPTRVLVFASPAGFERFAVELGEPATTDKPPVGLAVPSPDVLAPVAARYGIEVVGPPRRALG
ncbi:MAG: quercetin 2,3-dioxygenase [Chloroflexota bacterium]|nr:quercetin 2,3-dioxygenase [Chloroflexota bacterium]